VSVVKAPNILVFGGRGAIGSAVRRRFIELGWYVAATSRYEETGDGLDSSAWIVCDPCAGLASPVRLDAGKPYAAVCWAQGANLTDSILDVDASAHLDLYSTNCVFVLQTLRILLDRDLLAPSARLVVVSSIWQHVARQAKLSYTMSKAAIGGLVRSASVDLASRGFLINAVLPSVLDTPMTIRNLSPAQIKGIENATGFGRLCNLNDVVAAIEFLCSERNTSITGQSLTVDLGFSHGRLV
jgi:NAD(P)-dependent dehydrogenase (short-subunit alcohol dehydrogenase family)